jgi:hypothetical protein
MADAYHALDMRHADGTTTLLWFVTLLVETLIVVALQARV